MTLKERWTRRFRPRKPSESFTGLPSRDERTQYSHGRQYGNITVDGGGLTIVGDVHSSGSFFDRARESEDGRQFGLCLGAAPQIHPDHFVGRGQEMNEMARSLQPGAVHTEQQRLILGGMGGVGKTQLAITYAKRHARHYRTVCWLNATSELTLQDSFRLIVGRIVRADDLKRLNSDEILAHVHKWLSRTTNNQWLLIFDNYDNPDEFDISKYCPYAAHGSIIMTTRVPDLVRISGYHVRVKPLSGVDESLEILRKRSQRENIDDDPDAYRLAKRLDGLPLALATAGAYLNKCPQMTFQQYLHLYDQRWQVNHRRPQQLQDYHRDQSLYTTWNLSYARLKKDDPLAAEALKLLAYFDNQDIWYEHLRGGLVKSLPLWLQDLFIGQTEFESVMATLIDYCLVQVQPETQSYSIHNCVHDWTLAELNKVVDSQLYWYAVSCVAARIDMSGQKPYFRELKYARLTRHAIRCAHPRFVQIPRLATAKYECLDNMISLARLMTDQEQFSRAEQMYLRALANCDKIGGPNTVDTVSVLNDLGLLYRERKKLDEAGQMFSRALNICETALDRNDIATLETIRNYGTVHRLQGNMDEAERMCVQAYLGMEKTLGPHHYRTLDSKLSVANLYNDQGKFDVAAATYRKLIVEFEKISGIDDPSTIVIVNNLANTCCRLGNYAEAEQNFRRALAGYRTQLGWENTRTRKVLDELAYFYRSQGRREEAAALYR